MKNSEHILEQLQLLRDEVAALRKEVATLPRYYYYYNQSYPYTTYPQVTWGASATTGFLTTKQSHPKTTNNEQLQMDIDDARD